jgi:cell wall-associated NlpC family hydrolase
VPTTRKRKTAAVAAGTRTLHLTNPLLTGPDVKELQRLLKPYHPGTPDGAFGPATADAVRRAKRALGYPPDKCDGSAGAQLVAYLKGEPLPADFETRQAAVKDEVGSEQALRDAIVAFAEWGIANESQIHYEQLRPMDGIGQVHKLPLKTDCSGFSTLCYAWAGAPDPNGADYNGQGYTGSMLKHMQRIPAGAVQPADLVVWGEFPGHHVALVLKAGADPLVCSHGQEKGPFQIAVSQETTYQKTPPIYLTLPSWT